MAYCQDRGRLWLRPALRLDPMQLSCGASSHSRMHLAGGCEGGVITVGLSDRHDGKARGMQLPGGA